MDISNELVRYRAIAKEMDEEASAYAGLENFHGWREYRDRVNRRIFSLKLEIEYENPFPSQTDEWLYRCWR